ncbi:ATP phosphoribosyltransferase regulatory subunit [Nocardia nova]|nr:ATP phosphoribosyltransferase regulatory subunit [Nocardia nova]
MQQQLERRWFTQCALSGFQPVQVPPVGFTDTFVTGHHAAGERIYRFPDRRNRDLALVSDSLPALLRLAGSQTLSAQRLSYCCPVFRYERKPRRHFHHLGIMEVAQIPFDPELQSRAIRRQISIIADFLKPIVNAQFTITDPGIWYELTQRFVPAEKVSGYLDRLRRTRPQERGAALRADGAPAWIIATMEALVGDGNLDAINSAPESITVRIAVDRELVDLLKHDGINASLNLGELHASEFHDGIAFQVWHGSSLLGDGGSYGRFASEFLNDHLSSCAGVVGLEKVADLAGHHHETIRAADIAILAFPQKQSMKCADELTSMLRNHGIAVWDDLLTMPVRRHLRNIAALNIPLSLLIGENEVTSEDCRIRDDSGALFTVPKNDVRNWIAERIERAAQRM